jgi:uncharacterized protein (DUF427 family)
VKAVWKDTVLAESDETVVVEGNHYFPPTAINQAYFRDSTNRTVCPWKGVASYYDIVVGDDVNSGGAWYYPSPSNAAKNIEGYVAFWRGVRVVP